MAVAMLMMAVGVIFERRQEIDPAVRRLSSPSTRVCWILSLTPPWWNSAASRMVFLMAFGFELP